MRKKVLVGMSGGVDSSVTAAVLLEQGFDVIGVTMQIWPDTNSEIRAVEGGCCSLAAVDDARRVSNKLNIPYYVMNFKGEFQEKVIDYFTQEYLSGRTPNPCIMCNRYIKFESLLNKAVSMDIDYIATGHYAKIEYDEEKGRYLLKKSNDLKKDQTYVLYNMTQYQLSKTLMPLGYYNKNEVRAKARELGLTVAAKPDSQEICFVDDDYGKFIKEQTGQEIKEGYFKDTNGNILGKHKGIIHYTVGQRKGLGIAFGKPMYVVRIDAVNNEVILGEDTEVYFKGLIAGDLNLISVERLESETRVKAKIRYNAKEVPATVYPNGEDTVKVIFDEPQRAVTPGQSVVFYDDDIVIGGGTINESIS